MMGKSVNRIVVPHLYIDTSVFGGILEGQHEASVHLLETVKEKGWRCLTSAFTFMELSDIRQDNKFIYNQLALGVHIKKAYRSLDQRNLSPHDLDTTQESVDVLFSENYPFVEFFGLNEFGWDRALEIKATTNISAPDSVHVVTAIEAGCDVLVTLDNFIRKEAEALIPCCLPEQTNKVLKEYGFDI